MIIVEQKLSDRIRSSREFEPILLLILPTADTLDQLLTAILIKRLFLTTKLPRHVINNQHYQRCLT